MKKKFFVKGLVLVLLVSVLTLSLTGCRKPIDLSSFTEDFGKDGRNQTKEGILNTIVLEGEGTDTVYSALDKINENFANFQFVAVRGLVIGNTEGTVPLIGEVKTQQKIYSTTIKEYNSLGKTSKIFHEDASVSSQAIVKTSIVQMMQNIDGKGNSKIKTRYSIGENCKTSGLDYPEMIKLSHEQDFTNEKDYLQVYHQDLKVLLPYVLNIDTIDVNKSNITKRDDGYIEINISVKADQLQFATAEKRETIIIKSGYTFGEQKNSANDVIYNKLNIKIILWPNSYIRQIYTEENYDLNAFGMKQNCQLESNYYVSNDSTELPMSTYEF